MFVNPEVNVVKFNVADVITVSGITCDNETPVDRD